MKNKVIVFITVLIIVAVAIGLVVFISSTNTTISDEKDSATQEMYAFKINEAEAGAEERAEAEKEIKIGDNLLNLNLPEASNVYESESCAFDAIEKTYTYENYEITTCVKENSEDILSIYLTSDQVSTEEGIKIGDSVDAMKQAYGEDFELTDFSYVYRKGDSTLTFITDNDVITSIEYR